MVEGLFFILLLVIGAPLGAAALGAHLNSGGGRTGRLGFAGRVFAIFGVVMLIVLLLPMWTGYVASFFLPIPTVGLLAYWAVNRLRDMGFSSKTLAVLVGFPFLGFLVTIYLMVASPAATVDRPA